MTYSTTLKPLSVCHTFPEATHSFDTEFNTNSHLGMHTHTHAKTYTKSQGIDAAEVAKHLATIAAQGGPPGGKVEILQSQIFIYFKGKFGSGLTFENFYISSTITAQGGPPGGKGRNSQR